MVCRPFTRNESYDLINAASLQRDKTLIALGVSTGFRISELLSFKISDVCKIKNGIVTILKKVICLKQHVKGKTRSRACNLNTDARKHLLIYVKAELKAGKNRSNPLFTGQRNSGKTSLTRGSCWRIIKELATKAFDSAVEIGSHSFRKTYVCYLYLLNRDIYQTKSLIGHASVVTTDLYLKDAWTLIDDSTIVEINP